MNTIEDIRAWASDTTSPVDLEGCLQSDELLQNVYDDVELMDALLAHAADQTIAARIGAEANLVAGNPQAALDYLATRVANADDTVCFERMAELFADAPILGNASDAAEVHVKRAAPSAERARRLALAASMYASAVNQGGGAKSEARLTALLDEARSLEPKVLEALPRWAAMFLAR